MSLFFIYGHYSLSIEAPSEEAAMRVFEEGRYEDKDLLLDEDYEIERGHA